MGYREYADDEVVASTPRLFGFQAEGAAPLVHGAPVAEPETVATAIRIGNPASWDGATRAADESNGGILAVSDEAILAAQRRLMRQDGLFVEPASAASVAGLLSLHGSGSLPSGTVIVCVLTGHGLKDPQWGGRDAAPAVSLPADAASIARHLGLAAR
jgi:threonine synthase